MCIYIKMDPTPKEIVLHILTFLSSEDLFFIRSTSSLFHALCIDILEKRWKNKYYYFQSCPSLYPKGILKNNDMYAFGRFLKDINIDKMRKYNNIVQFGIVDTMMSCCIRHKREDLLKYFMDWCKQHDLSQTSTDEMLYLNAEDDRYFDDLDIDKIDYLDEIDAYDFSNPDFIAKFIILIFLKNNSLHLDNDIFLELLCKLPPQRVINIIERSYMVMYIHVFPSYIDYDKETLRYLIQNSNGVLTISHIYMRDIGYCMDGNLLQEAARKNPYV